MTLVRDDDGERRALPASRGRAKKSERTRPRFAAALRGACWGSLIGLSIHLGLLAAHLIQFRTVSHAVPNICAWAGRYPGYGYTWDLAALNLPARMVDRVRFLRGRGVKPQRVRTHGERPHPDPRWNASAWIAVGALGYAIAGAVAIGVSTCLVACVGRGGRGARVPRDARRT